MKIDIYTLQQPGGEDDNEFGWPPIDDPLGTQNKIQFTFFDLATKLKSFSSILTASLHDYYGSNTYAFRFSGDQTAYFASNAPIKVKYTVVIEGETKNKEIVVRIMENAVSYLKDSNYTQIIVGNIKIDASANITDVMPWIDIPEWSKPLQNLGTQDTDLSNPSGIALEAFSRKFKTKYYYYSNGYGVDPQTIQNEFDQSNRDRWKRKPLGTVKARDDSQRWVMSNGKFNFHLELVKSTGKSTFDLSPDLIKDGKTKGRGKITDATPTNFSSKSQLQGRFYLRCTEIGTRSYCHYLNNPTEGDPNQLRYYRDWLNVEGIFFVPFDTSSKDIKVTKDPLYTADAVGGAIIPQGTRDVQIYCASRYWGYYARNRTASENRGEVGMITADSEADRLAVGVLYKRGWGSNSPNSWDYNPETNYGELWTRIMNDPSAPRSTPNPTGSFYLIGHNPDGSGIYYDDRTYNKFCIQAPILWNNYYLGLWYDRFPNNFSLANPGATDSQCNLYTYVGADETISNFLNYQFKGSGYVAYHDTFDPDPTHWIFWPPGQLNYIAYKGDIYHLYKYENIGGSTIITVDLGYIQAKQDLIIPNGVTPRWPYAEGWEAYWGPVDIQNLSLPVKLIGDENKANSKNFSQTALTESGRYSLAEISTIVERILGGYNAIHYHSSPMFRTRTRWLDVSLEQQDIPISFSRSDLKTLATHKLTGEGQTLFDGITQPTEDNTLQLWNKIALSSFWTQYGEQGKQETNKYDRLDNFPYGFGVCPHKKGELCAIVLVNKKPFFIWRETDEDIEPVGIEVQGHYPQSDVLQATFEDSRCADTQQGLENDFWQQTAGVRRRIDYFGVGPEDLQKITSGWSLSAILRSDILVAPYQIPLGLYALPAPIYISFSHERAIHDPHYFYLENRRHDPAFRVARSSFYTGWFIPGEDDGINANGRNLW